MRSLDDARATCESFLPGLLDRLAAVPLAELESPGGPAIGLFRDCGGPGLVIPKEYSGAATTPLEALAVTRAIGAAAPSLAVATTMHHFSVSTLFTLADSIQASGMEWALLQGIAEQRLLVASGFAEGRPGQGILSPGMTAVRVEGGYVVSGSKKPCSLSRSMDLLTASVAVPGPDGAPRMAVILVPRDTPGISRHPFWSSWALAGAESDELRLTDVFVDDKLVMQVEPGSAGELDALQTVGLLWFALLISASYLGMVSRLVERVLSGRRGSVSERAELVIRLESAALLLEGLARMLKDGESDNAALGKALVGRYAAQDALAATASRSVELLGGMAFIGSSDIAYLAAASHGLALHPPSRTSVAGSLVDHAAGLPLTVA